MDRPWETESNSLTFEADGLLCAMQRGTFGVWCGYVSVGPEHPLFGLPINHPLKLPISWFDGRMGLEGASPIDVLSQVWSGKELEDACAISLAFQVHGGVSYANDRVPRHQPDGRWWFGFDCGHGGDHLPHGDEIRKIMDNLANSLPEETRRFLHEINPPAVYRDQQYVVSECQSLAAQLNAVTAVIGRK